MKQCMIDPDCRGKIFNLAYWLDLLLILNFQSTRLLDAVVEKMMMALARSMRSPYCSKSILIGFSNISQKQIKTCTDHVFRYYSIVASALWTAKTSRSNPTVKSYHKPSRNCARRNRTSNRASMSRPAFLHIPHFCCSANRQRLYSKRRRWKYLK